MTDAHVAGDAVAMDAARQQATPDAPVEPRPATDVRFGAAVYGSFLAASIIGVSYQAGEHAGLMATTLLASMVIFWLAHVWSDVVGHHVAAGSNFQPRDIARIARREWPLVEASIVPTLFLTPAAAGVWSRETGAVLAFASADIQITSWGLVAGLRSGATLLHASVLGAVQGTLGIALVALEGLIH